VEQNGSVGARGGGEGGTHTSESGWRLIAQKALFFVWNCSALACLFSLVLLQNFLPLMRVSLQMACTQLRLQVLHRHDIVGAAYALQGCHVCFPTQVSCPPICNKDSFCNPENLKFHDFGGACEKKFVTLAVAEITSIATLLSKVYESHATGAMVEFQ
jgi:hypothetical protein